MPVRRRSAEGRRDDMPGGFYSVPSEAQGAKLGARRVVPGSAIVAAAIVVASIHLRRRTAHGLVATHWGGQLQFGDPRVRP
jgi:hypothetical protein